MVHKKEMKQERLYRDSMNKQKFTTMCIIHKGFRGFRAFLLASNLGDKLRSFSFVISYEIIH